MRVRSLPSNINARPLKTFTCFRDLPAELRFLIWEAAMVPRIFTLRFENRKDTSEQRDQFQREQFFRLKRTVSPTVLQTCQESRRLAVKAYNLHRHVVKGDTRHAKRGIYVGQNIDTVLVKFDLKRFSMNPSSSNIGRKLLLGVRSLAVELHTVLDQPQCRFLDIIAKYTLPKELILVAIVNNPRGRRDYTETLTELVGHEPTHFLKFKADSALHFASQYYEKVKAKRGATYTAPLVRFAVFEPCRCKLRVNST